MMRRHSYVALVGALSLAGFGGFGIPNVANGASTTTTTKPQAPTVVTIKGNAITVSPATASAGKVSFVLLNPEKVSHELDIVKTDFAANGLPKKKNGQFDERAKGVKVVKEAVKIKGGATKNFTVTLSAGSYVLVDNLPGHYGQGEAVAFTVK